MILSIRNSLLFFAFLGIWISCGNIQKKRPLPFYNHPDFTPEWIEENNKNYPSIHTIPAFSFTDQDGMAVTEKTVEGKIYVVNFIFTRCGSICPKMTENMGILQKAFIDDPRVLLLSHSVTPYWDSVPVLKHYAERNKIVSSKWHLLTGNKDQIYEIAKKQYFAGDSVGYYGEKKDFLHTEHFILVDAHRRIRGIYNGTLPLEMERLKDDIHTLEEVKQ